MISTLELAVALTALLLLFGPEKMPEIVKQVSEAIKELREAAYGKDLKG